MTLLHYTHSNRWPQKNNWLSQFQKDLSNSYEKSNFSLNKELKSTEHDWSPAVDIHESDKQFIIEADVSGVAPEEIDIQIENNLLTIKGERKNSQSETNNRFQRSEIRKGSFSRSFSLPNTIDSGQIKASTKNGILRLELPKILAKQPQKIEIKH